MKKKVFDYIRDSEGASVHEISKGTNEAELNVLKAINNLSKEGYICLCSPIPLGIDNSNSCRYRVLKQDYTE